MGGTSKVSGFAGRLMLAIVFTVGLAAGGSLASAREPARTEQDLIDRVAVAIGAKDLDAISELVNWDGAPAMRRRIVTFQINYALGRPVKSVALEPFPQEGLQEVEAQGRLRANMPVTHRLRVVFDEADNGGVQPASLFLIGKIDGAFRIALVVRAKRAGED